MPKIIPDIRKNILASARTQLMAGGFRGLSLRRVADDCGIALGTTYHYFPSKNELAVAVIEDDWNREVSFVDEIDPQKIPFGKSIMHLYTSVRRFCQIYNTTLLVDQHSFENIVSAMVRRKNEIIKAVKTALSRIMIIYGFKETDSMLDLLAQCLFAAASSNTKEEDAEALIDIITSARKQK